MKRKALLILLKDSQTVLQNDWLYIFLIILQFLIKLRWYVLTLREEVEAIMLLY